jgi:hypothetical protein
VAVGAAGVAKEGAVTCPRPAAAGAFGGVAGDGEGVAAGWLACAIAGEEDGADGGAGGEGGALACGMASGGAGGALACEATGDAPTKPAEGAGCERSWNAQ